MYPPRLRGGKRVYETATKQACQASFEYFMSTMLIFRSHVDKSLCQMNLWILEADSRGEDYESVYAEQTVCV